MARTHSARLVRGGIALAAASAILLSAAAPASADTVIDGPVPLLTAERFAILASQSISNTGPSVISGDVGLSANGPSSVTGFDGQGLTLEGEQVFGSDAVTANGHARQAFNSAASLTPTDTGVVITQLDGLTLSPGTYAGGAVDLAVGGDLTFAGSDRSVWVMQVESALTINSNSTMLFTGGASACNVLWQVGSSATIGSSADFVGTVIAESDITLVTGADVQGRLLALSGSVVLDTNTIQVPASCPTTGTVSETTVPSITSPAPPDGTVGTPYSFTVTADGTPAPTYTVEGALPLGLTIDTTTGVISGIPTTPGATTFTVVADNPDSDDDSETYTVTITAAPPVSSPPVTPPDASAPPSTPGQPTAPAPTATAPGAGVPGGGGGGDGDDSSTRGQLPQTGTSPIGMLAGLALALMLVVAGLVVASRRGRPTSAIRSS
ncbi:hypothetical protein GCM10009846_04130 [Agrococcus versicolor]|uniref:Gram-positive cocci surface proteins LPxTG domain-containing protein n=1 Tax=Agrococcus versicolor TaxID=501482 RepID=A0ABN3AJZ1_9MICO